MAVALLSLFVALGGSASAIIINGKAIKDGTITGADIKNRSVKGRDVGRNTLTGSNIKESGLKTVPKALDATSADQADKAALADNAAKVGGLDVAGLVKLVTPKCPAGTLPHAGACIEGTLRPASDWRGAWDTCANVNRRLADLGEVYTLRRRVPAQNVEDELTADWFDFDAMTIVNNTGSPDPELAVGIGSQSARGDNEFRCVAPPLN